MTADSDGAVLWELKAVTVTRGGRRPEKVEAQCSNLGSLGPHPT